MSHLSNPLATAEQLYRWSSFSSLPPDLQDAVFFATQALTQAAGILLELPNSVTAKSNVILARYWLIDPLLANEFSDVSAACLYLVAKMGPLPRSPRDVGNVYAYLISKKSSLFRLRNSDDDDFGSYYMTETDYFDFQRRMLSLEARVLNALSFDTHVSLPHPLAVTYLQTLDFLSISKTEIAQRTVEYLNTALLSAQMVYLTNQPNALAAAAIYNAAKDLRAKMPECDWWEVFDVDREELGFLVVAMRSVEGRVKQLRDALPFLYGGMITKSMIDEELARRSASNENVAKAINAES